MTTNPQYLRVAALIAILAGSCIGAAPDPATQNADQSVEPMPVTLVTPDAPIAVAQPRVQVCFVLDTTGSMSGLIEGAKRKIWSIANQIIEAEPTPRLEISLLAYRDRGDEYVTAVFDLTSDMDAVYGTLTGFTADGGGDGPESVNQALREAVEKIAWDDGESTLRLIFLVGDAPPHMDYPDDVKYHDTCGAARSSDIIINTVQCGTMAGTGEIWREIAQATGGSYAAIEQSGGVTAISTPMDAELAELNVAIGETIIAYGTTEMRRGVMAKQTASEEAAPEVAPARLVYNAATDCIVQGGGDLIDAIDRELITLDKVEADELPEELQGMNPGELQAHIEAKRARRTAIQARISELLNARRVYIDKEHKRLAEEGTGDSFDAKILEILHEQAASKGMTYETKE